MFVKFLLLGIAVQLCPATAASLRKAESQQVSDQQRYAEDDAQEIEELQDSGLQDLAISEKLSGTSGAADTPFLMKRVEDVQVLEMEQQRAMQEQQRAAMVLERQEELLADRLAWLSDPVETPEEKAVNEQKYICSTNTSRPCGTTRDGKEIGSCDTFGDATCQDSVCTCDPGICADGHGRCFSENKAHLLPDVYKIELYKHRDNYMYVDREEDDHRLDFKEAKPGEKGQWRIVVNNDDSMMLYAESFGPALFMSIEDSTGLSDGKAFTSPGALSFEVHRKDQKQGHAVGGQLVHLKDIHSKLWLSVVRRLGGNGVHGIEDFPGDDGAFIFHPPLPGSMIEKKKKEEESNSASFWPLLPFLLAVFSSFGSYFSM